MPNPNSLSPAALHAQAWAEDYDLIDLQLSPLGLKAMEVLRLRPDDVVLDIGCGTGQSLIQLAERVGTSGQVIGIDIAPLLLEVAASRTKGIEQIKLLHADAQSVDLPTHCADALFSRFGVMAFSDPVAAFANFRRILKPSGALSFCCWRSLQENRLDYLPLSAAGLEPADTRPFSFADPEFVSKTLATAGFKDIRIQAHDQFVSSGDLEAMTSVLLKVGPLGKIVREAPSLRPEAESRLREALLKLGNPSAVELQASIWIVTAQAG